MAFERDRDTNLPIHLLLERYKKMHQQVMLITNSDAKTNLLNSIELQMKSLSDLNTILTDNNDMQYSNHVIQYLSLEGAMPQDLDIDEEDLEAQYKSISENISYLDVSSKNNELLLKLKEFKNISEETFSKEKVIRLNQYNLQAYELRKKFIKKVKDVYIIMRRNIFHLKPTLEKTFLLKEITHQLDKLNSPNFILTKKDADKFYEIQRRHQAINPPDMNNITGLESYAEVILKEYQRIESLINYNKENFPKDSLILKETLALDGLLKLKINKMSVPGYKLNVNDLKKYKNHLETFDLYSRSVTNRFRKEYLGLFDQYPNLNVMAPQLFSYLKASIERIDKGHPLDYETFDSHNAIVNMYMHLKDKLSNKNEIIKSYETNYNKLINNIRIYQTLARADPENKQKFNVIDAIISQMIFAKENISSDLNNDIAKITLDHYIDFVTKLIKKLENKITLPNQIPDEQNINQQNINLPKKIEVIKANSNNIPLEIKPKNIKTSVKKSYLNQIQDIANVHNNITVPQKIYRPKTNKIVDETPHSIGNPNTHFNSANKKIDLRRRTKQAWNEESITNNNKTNKPK